MKPQKTLRYNEYDEEDYFDDLFLNGNEPSIQKIKKKPSARKSYNKSKKSKKDNYEG